MTHLVIVNDKYLVAVDANTAGGAEHRILDRLPYEGVVTSCMAFAPKDWSTDYFAIKAAQCETMSISEIETMAAVISRHMKEVAEAQKAVDHLERNILELQRQLNQEIINLHKARTTRDDALAKLNLVSS